MFAGCPAIVIRTGLKNNNKIRPVLSTIAGHPASDIYVCRMSCNSTKNRPKK
jgi:hypothetical protein